MNQSRVPYMDTVYPPYRKLSASLCTFPEQQTFFLPNRTCNLRASNPQTRYQHHTWVHGLETQCLYRPKNCIFNVVWSSPSPLNSKCTFLYFLQPYLHPFYLHDLLILYSSWESQSNICFCILSLVTLPKWFIQFLYLFNSFIWHWERVQFLSKSP